MRPQRSVEVCGFFESAAIECKDVASTCSHAEMLFRCCSLLLRFL